MKVSVLIPVHDAEPYLRECLDSVLAQTMGDFEVVCVDDGSTDGSAAVLADYAARDPRVRVVSQPCGGVSAARNVALAQARGDYVQFVDADDMMEPHLLEHAVRTAEDLRTQMTIFGFYEYFAGFGAFVPNTLCSDPDLQGRAFSLADVKGPMTTLTTPSVWHILFERSFLEQGSASFSEDLRTAEDLVFTYEALARAQRVALLGEHLYRYRRDGGTSLTRADRGTDGFRAVETLARRNDGRWTQDPMLLRHYVNLVLDVVRYDLFSASSQREFRELYDQMQQRLLPFVREHDDLVDPMYRPFLEQVSQMDALAYLFGLYADHRDGLESQAAWRRATQAALDESRAAVELGRQRLEQTQLRMGKMRRELRQARQDEWAVRHSWSFRIGRVITALPSKAKHMVGRVLRGGR